MKLFRYKIRFLVKKGLVNQLFIDFKDLASEEKKILGKELNVLKSRVEELYNNAEVELRSAQCVNEKINPLPGYYSELGSRHPISAIIDEMTSIFERLGFSISTGPEIEDDWHNFTALNLPEYHPARDMQDTFFIQTNPDTLLRTHTSSVQVRYMENNKPPIRTISPGRVFRNEAVSSRSHCIFHQVEGLYIDKDVSFADLKQTLLYFTKESIVQKIIFELKYKQNKKAGYLFGRLIANALVNNSKYSQIDYLIPIPISKRKLKKRGFNQSLIICEAIIANGYQVPIFTGLVTLREGATQTHKDRLQRSAETHSLFSLTQFNTLKGKHLLIIDDVITTGATLETACACLMQAQPASIQIATAAYTYY